MRRVETTWQEGRLFESKNAEGSSIFMDVLKEKGGSGKGVTPVEALLGAVAACTGIDMVNILTKMRCEIKSLRIVADSTQTPEHPMYFDYIKLTYYVSGENINEKKVQKAIDLSVSKYCTVKASMTDKCRFDTEIVIE